MDERLVTPRRAFRLKGTMPALTMLTLLTEDVAIIEQQLASHISQMPQFFLHAPVVLDLEPLGDTPVNLLQIADILRRHQLVPVAVRNPTEAQKERAVTAGWGVLQTTLVRPAHTPAPSVKAEASTSNFLPAPRSGDASAAPPGPVERQLAGLTVKHPVRSGQVVYAVGGESRRVGAGQLGRRAHRRWKHPRLRAAEGPGARRRTRQHRREHLLPEPRGGVSLHRRPAHHAGRASGRNSWGNRLESSSKTTRSS